MKCPQCGHNHLRGKRGMTCSKCKRTFILDPKRWVVGGTLGVTDGRFLGVIKRASGNDTRYFTANEFYTHARMKLKTGWFGLIPALIMLLIGGGMIVFAAGSVIASNDDSGISGGRLFMIILGGFFSFAGVGVLFSTLQKLPREKWDKIVATWKAREPIPRLLEEPRLHQPPPDWKEPDIYAYGAERLIICQHDLLVDWLVLNEFHLNERSLVLSESGYPEYLLGPVQELLRAQPDMPIFLLHDGTPLGTAMNERILKNPKFEVGSHPIVDLGLYADDVRKLRLPSFLRRQDQLAVDCIPFVSLTTMAALGLADQIALSTAAQSLYTSNVEFWFEYEIGKDSDFG